MRQRPSLPSVWRPSQLRKHQDCHCGRETGLLDSALLISTSTTPERFLRVRWHFVQYQADSSQQRPFKGQTDCREPCRSDGYKFVSTYAHNDIINYHLGSFFPFRGFYFVETGLSAKIAKICTQRKFPAIRYYVHRVTYCV